MRSQLRVRVLLPVAVLALLGLGVGAFAFSGTPADEPIPGPKPHKHAAAPAKKKDATKGKQRANKHARHVVTLVSWRKRANTICNRATVHAADLEAGTTVDAALKNLNDQLDYSSGVLDDLAALRAPRAQARSIDRMVAFFREFLATERQAGEALGSGDFGSYIDLNSKAFLANDRGSKIAKRLGALACAEGTSAKSLLRHELARHGVVVVVVAAPDSDVDSIAIGEARHGALEAGAGFFSVNVYSTRQVAALALDYDLRAAPTVLVFKRGMKVANVFTSYVDSDLVEQAALNAAS
jgi:hypothetical protein